jgi:RNA-directed DNA polymerase
LVHGTENDTQVVRENVTKVLAPVGLQLSPAKTQIVHLSDGFDFLGFHIQWRRKRGTGKWHVYTFIADRPIRSAKVKIRALTHRQSQQELGSLLIRLNQIMRGWANYFKHAVAKDRFAALHRFVWWRLIRMLQVRHRWSWKDVRRHFTIPTGRWLPIMAADGTVLFNMAKMTVTRYRWRSNTIPNRWTPHPA